MPTTDLTELDLEGLRYECLEPDRRYRVRYDDGDATSVDLEYTGLRELWVASDTPAGGHTDQPCSVVGTVRLGDETVDIDCLGMRDRTWSPRPDDRTGRGTGYTYGIGSADSQFLMLTQLDGNRGSHTEGVFRGYLVRDGEASPLESSMRRVTSRRNGAPYEIEVEGADRLGRHFSARGRRRNTFANHATPGSFAWMSMFEWHTDAGMIFGQDQEVWSPDMLGSRLATLEAEVGD